jgi:hypothetical protein
VADWIANALLRTQSSQFRERFPPLRLRREGA